MKFTDSNRQMRPASDAERKALGIPPAYFDVLIAVDPKADLIATATIKTKSGKIKTFYRYSKSFIAGQADKKWARVRKLGAKAEKIEARLTKDCTSGDDIAVAQSARLIMLTGMRNGNPPQGEGESYGASSLLMSHISLSGDTITFDFIGKKGVAQHYVLTDSLLASYVRERRSRSETRLFPHDANATLKYLKSIGAAKCHDFRTWRANEFASILVDELVKDGIPTSKKGIKLLKKTVATAVGAMLGNNASQAMKSYISPKVWEKVDQEETE